MATAPEQRVTALLTEHLAYTPLTFVDDTINLTNRVVYKTTDQVEDFFARSTPSSLGFVPPDGGIFETDDDGNELLDENAMDEISNGMHQFEMLMENGVDRGFDGFELYALRNIFNLPEDIRDWVRLGHHKDLDFSHAIAPGASLPKMVAINTLRKQIQEVTCQEAAFKSEMARNEAMIQSLKSIVHPTPAASASNPHPLSFMFRQTPAMQAVKPVPETAAFAVQQIHTLKQMISNLRETATDLVDKQPGEDDDAMEIDKAGQPTTLKGRERALYVEKMSRRHLERARGLNLTAEGALKTGEGDLKGERKKEGDAALMETLAGMISERKPEENR